MQMQQGEQYECKKCGCEVSVTVAPTVASKGGQGSLVCCGVKMSAKALATPAERIGRTMGRIAGKIDKVRASRKKAKPPARGTKKPPKDLVAAAKQTKLRGSWKAQERSAESAVKVQHGVTVDERALTRATNGQRWAARQTR